MLTHKRKIYDIVALLGDLGGVTEVIMLAMGCLLFPIAESSYNMMSTKRMFIARTRNDDLFDEASEARKKKWFLSEKSMPEGIKSKLRLELKKHRVIQFGLKDKLCYYLHNQLGQFFICGCCWRNRKQLTTLVDEAQDRLDSELNIIKMI